MSARQTEQQISTAFVLSLLWTFLWSVCHLLCPSASKPPTTPHLNDLQNSEYSEDYQGHTNIILMIQAWQFSQNPKGWCQLMHC